MDRNSTGTEKIHVKNLNLLQFLTQFFATYHYPVCDVLIRVNNVEFSAHHQILTAASPYFARLLSGTNMYPGELVVVYIKDVRTEIFSDIINYIYSGELYMNASNMDEYLMAAKYFELENLRLTCVRVLSEDLNIENWIKSYRLAYQFSCMDLMHTVYSFIATNFKDLIIRSEFYDLPFEEFADILSYDGIDCFEEQIYVAMMKWIKRDLDEREQYLQFLMGFICLPLIPDWFFGSIVLQDPIIKANQKIHPMLNNAFKLMENKECYSISGRRVVINRRMQPFH